MSHYVSAARLYDMNYEPHNIVDPNVTSFDTERPRLTAIACQILGSDADAFDVLQEAWLRFNGTNDVLDPQAWLTTVVTRLCLDHLRKQSSRSTAEGLLQQGGRASDPEADALLVEKLGGAMQVVIDIMAPPERAAFVLHDVFGYRFDEISVIMGRSNSAVRKLASRARHKVQGMPESPTAQAENRQVVDAFLAAAHGGDLATLLLLIAPDAVMHVDSVGRAMGVDSVFNGANAIAARFNGSKGALAVTIDHEPGAAWIQAGIVKVAFVFQVTDGQVHEIELIADPDVLSTMVVMWKGAIRS